MHHVEGLPESAVGLTLALGRLRALGGEAELQVALPAPGTSRWDSADLPRSTRGPWTPRRPSSATRVALRLVPESGAEAGAGRRRSASRSSGTACPVREDSARRTCRKSLGEGGQRLAEALRDATSVVLTKLDVAGSGSPVAEGRDRQRTGPGPTGAVSAGSRVSGAEPCRCSSWRSDGSCSSSVAYESRHGWER